MLQPPNTAMTDLTDLHEARAAAPSDAEFERLYRQHVDGVWKFVERLGVPSRFLEDAVQDTFVIAHRRLAAFRAESSVKTWLHGIAIKVAKDYRRREGRKGGWDELLPTTPDPRSSPHDSVARREELDLVLQLLEQLDEQQRTVFVLVDFEGYTAPEVAELTQTNVNTVSTRLRAARHRFNELAEAASVRGVA